MKMIEFHDVEFRKDNSSSSQVIFDTNYRIIGYNVQFSLINPNTILCYSLDSNHY